MGLGSTFSLESWILWAINTYLTEFLLDVDEKDIASSLLGSGSVHLKNVKINPDIFLNIGVLIPIKIIVAKVDFLHVTIGWIKRKVDVEIEGLTILGETLRQAEWTDQKELVIRAMEAAKKNILNEFDQDVIRPERPTIEYPVFSKVLPLLDVNMKDANVRLEDWDSNRYQPFALGVRVQHLALNPRDGHHVWRERFLMHATSPTAPLLGINLRGCNVNAYCVPLPLQFVTMRNHKFVKSDHLPVYPGPDMVETFACVGPGEIVAFEDYGRVRVRWQGDNEDECTMIHTIMPQKAELRLTAYKWEECEHDAQCLCDYVIEEAHAAVKEGVDIFPGIDVLEFGVYLCKFQTDVDHAGRHLLPYRSPPHRWAQAEEELPPCTLFIRFDGKGKSGEFLKVSSFQIRSLIGFGTSFGVFSNWLAGLSGWRWPGAPTNEEEIKYRHLWRQKITCLKKDPTTPWEEPDSFVEFEDKWFADAILFERQYALWEVDNESDVTLEDTAGGMCNGEPRSSLRVGGKTKIMKFTLDIEVANSSCILISNWPRETIRLSDAAVTFHFDLLQIRVDVEAPSQGPNVNIEVGLTNVLGLLPRHVHLLDTDRFFIRLRLGGISKKLHIPGYRDQRFRMWIAVDPQLNLTAMDMTQVCSVANLIVNAITLPDMLQEALTRGNVHVTEALQHSFVLEERHFLPWIMSLHHFDPILDIPLIFLSTDVFRLSLWLGLSPTTQSDSAYSRVLKLKTKIHFRSMPKYKKVLHCELQLTACQATEEATLCKSCPAIRVDISTSRLDVSLHSTVVESMLDMGAQLVRGFDKIHVPPVPPSPVAPTMDLVPLYADVRITEINIYYESIDISATVKSICLMTSITKSEFFMLLKICGVRISSENSPGVQKLPHEHILEWGKLGIEKEYVETLGPIKDVSTAICTPEPGIAVRFGIRCFSPAENDTLVGDKVRARVVGSIAEENSTDDLDHREVSEYEKHLHTLVLGPLWLSANWGALLRMAADAKAVNEFMANMDSLRNCGSTLKVRRTTESSGPLLLDQRSSDRGLSASYVSSDEMVEEPISVLSTFGIQGPYLILADCSIDSIHIFLPADEKSGICVAMSAKMNLSQDIDPQESGVLELDMYRATINVNMLVSNLRIAVGTAEDMMNSKSPSAIKHTLFPSRFEIRLMREVPGYILADDHMADYNYIDAHSRNSFEIQSTSINFVLNPENTPKILSVYGTIICHMDTTGAAHLEAQSDAREITVARNGDDVDESRSSVAPDVDTTLLTTLQSAVPLGKWTAKISVGNVVLQLVEPARCSSLVDVSLEDLIMNGTLSKLTEAPDVEVPDREVKPDGSEYRILCNANVNVTASVLGFSARAGKMVPVIEPVLIAFKNEGPRHFDLNVTWFNINFSLDVTDSFRTGACDLASALDMAYVREKQKRKMHEQATLDNLKAGMRVEPLLGDVEGWPLTWEEPGSMVIEIKEDLAFVQRPDGNICMPIEDLSIGLELPFHPTARVARMWVCYYDQVKYIVHALLRLRSANEPMSKSMTWDVWGTDSKLDIIGRAAQLVNDTGVTLHCSDQHMGRQRKQNIVLPGKNFGVLLDEKSGSQLEVVVLLPVHVRRGETEIFHVLLQDFNFTSETLQVVERKLLIDSDSRQKKTLCRGVDHLKLTKFVTARILIRTEMTYASTNLGVFLSSHIHIANRTDVTFLLYSPTSDTPLVVEPSTSRQALPLHWLMPLKEDSCPMVYFALQDSTMIRGNIANFLHAHPNSDYVHHLVPKRTWRHMFNLRSRNVRDYQTMKGHIKRLTDFKHLMSGHHRNQYVDVCTSISAVSSNMESHSDCLVFVIGIDWALKFCNRLPSTLDIIVGDVVAMPDGPSTPKRADTILSLTASVRLARSSGTRLASASGARERLRGLAPTEVITLAPGDDCHMPYIPRCVRFKLDDAVMMKSVNPFMIGDVFRRQRVQEDISVFFFPASWKYQEAPPILEVTCEVGAVIRKTGAGRMQTFSWPSPSRQFLLYAPYWIINRREDCDFFLNVNAPLVDVKSPLMQIPSNTLRLLHDEKPMLRIGVTNCWKAYTEQGADIESQMDRGYGLHSGTQNIHYMLSDSFRINQVHYDGTVIIPRDEHLIANPIQRWLGYSVDAAPYPFYRTLVVTLCRKFTVVNHKDHPLWIQFSGEHGWQQIHPQQTLPMDPQGESNRGTADIFLSGEPSSCRGSVAQFELSTFGHFQVRHPIEAQWAAAARFPSTGKYGKRHYCVTMVEISHAVETSASIVIRFLEPIIPDFRLVNSTSTLVTFLRTTTDHGVKSLLGKAKMTVLQGKAERQRAEMEESLCLHESSAYYSFSSPANRGKIKIVIDNKQQVYDIGVIRLHKEKIEISAHLHASEDKIATASALANLMRRNFWPGVAPSANQELNRQDSCQIGSALDSYWRQEGMRSGTTSELLSGLRQPQSSQIDEREDTIRTSEQSGSKVDAGPKRRIQSRGRSKIVFHVRTLIKMGVREVHVFNRYTFRYNGHSSTPIILRQSSGEQVALFSGSPVALDKLDERFQFSLSEDILCESVITPEEASCKLDTTRFLSIPLTRQGFLPFSEQDYKICKLRIIYEPFPGKWEFSLSTDSEDIPPYVIKNQTDFDLLVCDAGHGRSSAVTNYWIAVERGRSVPFALFHCDTSTRAMRHAKLNHGMLNVRVAEEANTIKLIHLKLAPGKEGTQNTLFSNLDIFYSLRRIGDCDNSHVLVTIEHHTGHFRPDTRRMSMAHTQQSGILQRVRRQVTFPHLGRSLSAAPSSPRLNVGLPNGSPVSKSVDFGSPDALLAMLFEVEEAQEAQASPGAPRRSSSHLKYIATMRSHVLRNSSDQDIATGSGIFESEDRIGSSAIARFSSLKHVDAEETTGKKKSPVPLTLKKYRRPLHQLAVNSVSLTIELEGIGMSLNDNYVPEEVAFFCLSKIAIMFVRTVNVPKEYQISASLNVENIHMDVERGDARVPTLYIQKSIAGEEEPFIDLNFELLVAETFSALESANIRISHLVIDLDSKSVFQVFRWVSATYTQVNLGFWNEQASIRRGDPTDPKLCAVTFEFEKADYRMQAKPLVIEHLFLRKLRILISARFANLNIDHFYTDDQEALQAFYKISRRFLLIDVSNAEINVGVMSTVRGISDLEWNSMFVRTAAMIPERLFHDVKKSLFLALVLTLGAPRLFGNPRELFRQIKHALSVLRNSSSKKSDEDDLRSTKTCGDVVWDMLDYLRRLLAVFILILLAVFDSLAGVFAVISRIATGFAAGALPDCSQTTATSVSQALREGFAFGVPWNWYKAIQKFQHQLKRLFHSGIALKGVYHVLGLFLVGPRLFIGFFAGLIFFGVKCHEGSVVILHCIVKALHPSIFEALNPPALFRDPNSFHAFCLEGHNEAAACCYAVLLKKIPNLGTEMWSFVNLSDFASKPSPAGTTTAFAWVEKHGLFYIQKRKVVWKFAVHNVYKAEIKHDAPTVLIFEGNDSEASGAPGKTAELHVETEELAVEIFVKLSELIHYRLKQQTWKSGMCKRLKFAQYKRRAIVERPAAML